MGKSLGYVSGSTAHSLALAVVAVIKRLNEYMIFYLSEPVIILVLRVFRKALCQKISIGALKNMGGVRDQSTVFICKSKSEFGCFGNLLFFCLLILPANVRAQPDLICAKYTPRRVSNSEHTLP